VNGQLHTLLTSGSGKQLGAYRKPSSVGATAGVDSVAKIHECLI